MYVKYHVSLELFLGEEWTKGSFIVEKKSSGRYKLRKPKASIKQIWVLVSEEANCHIKDIRIISISEVKAGQQ